MPVTLKQAMQAVYSLLRDPPQEKLYFEDVRDRLNDRLRGFVEDMDLSGRDHRTVTTDIDVAEDDIDYTVAVANVPDFEPVTLEYSRNTSSSSRAWYEAKLIPFAAWSQHAGTDRLVASFYGSFSLVEGQKLKLNIAQADVATTYFRLSYRLPLLTLVQEGERPPIPEGHMPLLHYGGALDCIDIVKDDSKPWIDWVARTTPKYLNRYDEELKRWNAYLEKSVEDPVQPLRAFDAFRRSRGRQMPRAYLPRA